MGWGHDHTRRGNEHWRQSPAWAKEWAEKEVRGQALTGWQDHNFKETAILCNHPLEMRANVEAVWPQWNWLGLRSQNLYHWTSKLHLQAGDITQW